MQVIVTDKLLMDIYSIKNISSISIYDIVSLNNVLPGLVVFFDGAKCINLCAADKYFPELVRKTFEVYQDESKKTPISPFKDKTISIDDHSKAILESGALENVSDYYAFYDGKKGYNHSLLYEIDEVKLLLPIIKYHLKALFSHTDVVINIAPGITGYRTNYVIPATINGLESELFLSITKNSDISYELSIQGLTPKNSSISMAIEFSEYGLNVYGSIPRYNIDYSYSYKSENGVIKKHSSVVMNNIPIDYHDSNLPETSCSNSNLIAFDIPQELKFYALPWGALYGYNEKIDPLSENEAIKHTQLEYFSAEEDSFMRREFISDIYASRVSRMTLTRLGKSVNAYSLDNQNVELSWDDLLASLSLRSLKGIDDNKNRLYVVETSFVDDISGSGYYEQNLRGKSFYHICSIKDIKSLMPTDLVAVDEDKGVLAGSDFMDKARLLSLIKGEK